MIRVTRVTIGAATPRRRDTGYLALGGTIVDFVQAHAGLDNGSEWDMNRFQ